MSPLSSSEKGFALRLVLCTAVACPLFFLAACNQRGTCRCCGSSYTPRGGCSSQPTELSGRWNETDAKKVADEMIGGDMLESEWLQRWEKNHEGRPAVTIYPIQNKTMQHIDVEIFIKDIERNLATSGKVRFVSFWNERRDLRTLRCGRALRCESTEPPHVKKKKAPEHAAERGGDHLLLGTINSTVQDTLQGDKRTLLYTVTLKLVNVATNEEAWSSEKEIKKIVKRSKINI